jgi:LacI family transcriptional regulator
MDTLVENSLINKSVTIHDVAAQLGMHKSTVSLALSGKGNVSKATRARVAEVATAMGYEPNPLAQRLANGVNNSLVCLCAGGLDVGLTTEKILLIQQELGRLSLEVPIYTFSDPLAGDSLSQAAQVRNLCRQHPRAVVIAVQTLNPAIFDELHAYQAKGGIVVSYDIAVPLQCDQVVFDRQDNAYQGAKYLIDRGHTKIGFGMSVGGNWPSNNKSLPQNQRLLGFQKALKEAGLPFREEWMFRHSAYEMGGAELARHFLSCEDRPTGLCIVNDYVSLAFMVEMSNRGIRVPQDVSIVGHDNQPVASYCPVPLTSVSQPTREIAGAVVQLLLERLNGSNRPPETVVIRGELIERRSVVPA